jgi:hypothetical protein
MTFRPVFSYGIFFASSFFGYSFYDINSDKFFFFWEIWGGVKPKNVAGKKDCGSDSKNQLGLGVPSATMLFEDGGQKYWVGAKFSPPIFCFLIVFTILAKPQF